MASSGVAKIFIHFYCVELRNVIDLKRNVIILRFDLNIYHLFVTVWSAMGPHENYA